MARGISLATVLYRATLCGAARTTAPRWRGSRCRSEPMCRCAGVTSCGPQTASWCWRTTSGCPQGCRICSPAGRRSGAPSRVFFVLGFVLGHGLRRGGLGSDRRCSHQGEQTHEETKLPPLQLPQLVRHKVCGSPFLRPLRRRRYATATGN